MFAGNMPRSPPAHVESNGNANAGAWTTAGTCQDDLAPRQWRCEDCPKAFKKRDHLLRHIQSHTKKKPFACTICSKKYSRQDSLLRHARSHATSLGKYKPSEAYNLAQSSTASLTDDEGENDGTNDEETANLSSERSLPDIQSTFAAGYSGSSANAARNTSSEYPFIGGAQTLPFPDNVMLYPDCGLGSFAAQSKVYDPSWLLGGDFDLQALNYSTSVSGPTQCDPIMALDRGGGILNNMPTVNQGADADSHAGSRQAIQNEWYTRAAPDLGHAYDPLEQASDRDKVDDTYRLGLSSQLMTVSYDSSLPSTDFLNLCIKLYFAKFHPVFPIVHASTFRPSAETSLLVLSVCSLGAVFVGTPASNDCSRALFLRLNKAILASWERFLHRGGHETLAMLQAMVIGQTAGLLSDSAKEVVTAASFHGTLITWARQAGAFQPKEAIPTSEALHDDRALNLAWRSWARKEETIRLIHALHIHDAQFATLFHHDPFLRHIPEKLPVSSEDLFVASTASQWREQAESARSSAGASHDRSGMGSGMDGSLRQQRTFDAYVSLSGILATIAEARCSSSSDPNPEPFRCKLIQCYETHLTSLQNPLVDTACLRILWHEAFLALYVSLDLLDRVVGRDGFPLDSADIARITNWVNDASGQRCAMHSMLIVDRMRALRIGTEPAIHVPAAMFYAGCVIYCHVKYGMSSGSRQPAVDAAELQCVTQLDARATNVALDSHRIMDSSVLYEIIDLLRRQGHWGLSKRFASILELVLTDLE